MKMRTSNMRAGRATGARGRMHLALAAFVVFSLAISEAAWAATATCVWNRATELGWNSSSTYWSCGHVPDSDDIVEFDGTGVGNCLINTDPSVGQIHVKSGYSGTIKPDVASTRTITIVASGTADGSLVVDDGVWNAMLRVTASGNFQLNGDAVFNAPDILGVGGYFQLLNSTAGGAFNGGTGTLLLTAKTTPSASHNFTGAATESFYDVVVNDGLIGYWRLDESAVGTAVDSSGWKTNLTHTNTPTFNSSPQAKQFYDPYALTVAKASRQYASTTAYPKQFETPVFTISAWINHNATLDTSGGDIINIHNDYGLRLYATDELKTWRQNGSTRSGCWTSTEDLTNTGWHHVAASFDGSAFKMYVDGANITTSLTSEASAGCTGFSAKTVSSPITPGLTVGVYANSSGTDYDFDGSIDEVRVFDRVLTLAEIADLANGTHSRLSLGQHTFGTALIVGHDFTIASGSVTSSYDISVAGSWRNFGGLYTNTAGTVTFTGTGAQEIMSNGQLFGAVTLNGSGGTWTLSDPLYVFGATTLTAGTLAASTYLIRTSNMSASSGAFTPGTGTLVLEDNGDRMFTPPGALNSLRVEDPTESNLVGYWKFDRLSGSTSPDSSGTGNTATLNNGTLPIWASASLPTLQMGNTGALVFDGLDATATGDYVSIGVTSLPSATDTQTITMWVKWTSDGDTQDFLSLNNGTNGIRIGTGNTNKVRVLKYDGTQLVESTANVAPDGAWNFVAYTYESGTNRLYINTNSPVSASVANTAATPTNFLLGATATGTAAGRFAGSIDDVRIYSVRLTDTQLKEMAGGRYPGRSGTSTVTLGGNLTVNGLLAIDSGTLAAGSATVSASHVDTAQVALVNAGGYTVGSATSTFKGGLTVRNPGTLTMGSASGTLSMGNGTTLIVDGSLVSDTGSGATKPTIQAVSTTYTFSVGSTSTATPTMNINGLAVKNTGTNGMFINAVAGSSTTFTRFDNITFSNGTAGTPSSLLQIAAGTLSLFANGLSFDTTGSNATSNVTLTDTDGTGNDVRMTIGGTCVGAESDCEAYDADDDTGSDGFPNDSGTDGSVIQWVQRAYGGTGGSVEGFPASAFDWDDFDFKGTYVLFNNYSSTADKLSKRDVNGDEVATWPLPNSEDFVGPARWTWSNGTFYVFMLTTAGRVYKVRDDDTAFADIGNYRDGSSATATSPLAVDRANLYWAGKDGSGTNSIISITQGLVANGSEPASALYAVPAIETVGGANYLFSATNGAFYKMPVDMSGTTPSADPPTTAVSGRVSTFGGLAYYIQDDGYLRAVNTSTLVTDWFYQDTASGHPACTTANACGARNIFVNQADRRVYYGDRDGHLYAVYKTGGVGDEVPNFPWRPGASTDVFESAPMYRAGIIAIGTYAGKVFFVDQVVSGGAPALLKTYNFGEEIKTISYDPSGTGRYMVATGGGRLYYVDAITDTTGN